MSMSVCTVISRPMTATYYFTLIKSSLFIKLALEFEIKGNYLKNIQSFSCLASGQPAKIAKNGLTLINNKKINDVCKLYKL